MYKGFEDDGKTLENTKVWWNKNVVYKQSMYLEGFC